MSLFNEDQIRNAIDRLQEIHPASFLYDITSFEDKKAIDEIKNVIDRISEKAEKDTEIHIICEMAKQYMNGARPIYNNRPKGKWIKQENKKTEFFCSECGRMIDTKPFTRTDHFPFCHCGADMRGGTDNGKC